MARVTPQGIQTRSLTEYLELTEENFKEAFGQDLDLAPETPQGQLAGIMALGFTEVEEAIAWLASGMSLHTSEGQQIDDWGSMLNLPRKPATFSTVVLKFVVNQPAGEFNNGNHPTIPEGVLVRAENDDTHWRTITPLPLDTFVERDGTVERVSGTVVARPVRPGQIFAPENSLDTPVSVISNLYSVTNPSAALPGINAETDAEYRIRHDRVVARASGNSTQALRARLLLLTGVVDAYVQDNPGPGPLAIGGINLPEHNVLVITRAPAVTEADIAQAIFNTMPPGVPTYHLGQSNSRSVDASTLDARVVGRDINWLEANEVPVKMVVVLNPLQNFPAGGLATVLRRLGQYFRGEWRSGEGDFETSGISIGQFPDNRRLYSPINSVPGHTIRLMNIYRAGEGFNAITEVDIGPDDFLVLRESETIVQIYALPTLPDIQDRSVARNTGFDYQMPQPLTGNNPFIYSIRAKQGTPALPGDWALDGGTLEFSGNSGNAARTYTLELVVTDVTGDIVVGEWELEVL